MSRSFRQVEDLNHGLLQVRDLNILISKALAQGRDTSALEDNRQMAIDRLSEIVPLREVPRDRGAVALYTTGGAVLLDGTAAKLEFSRTNVIQPHMTQSNTLLSGLAINGKPVSQQGCLAVRFLAVVSPHNSRSGTITL